MKRLLILLLVLMLPIRAMAATLPSYSPKFGNAMAGLVQQKTAARGFAANDPRFIATEAAIGTALTGVATGLAAAAGAPLWATIAVGAVTAGAVALGIGALTNWLFNDDGTVTPTTTTSMPGSTYDTQTFSVANFQYPLSGSPIGSKDGLLAAYNGVVMPFLYPPAMWGVITRGLVNCGYTWTGAGGAYTEICYVQYQPGETITTYHNHPSYTISSSQVCAGGYYAGGSCTSQGWPTPPAPTPKKISDEVANVPDADMGKPVNPDLLAQAVNRAWQQAAAQPGYQGLPYIASDPVTSGDVQQWQSANPSSYPTVSDMLAPAVSPSTSAVAQPVAPGTEASPGIQTGTAGEPAVNLGVDPVVPLPTLEATPTAQMIMNPLLGLFPDLKSFVVPSHSAECPKPSMTLFGRALLLDGHCSLLDSIRPTLYAVMAAVWIVIALFIILAA